MDLVNLTHVHGVDRQRCWRNGPSQSYAARTVTFGRLADGRWWADMRGYGIHGDQAYVYGSSDRDRERALRLAYRWMRETGGQWLPTPAAFGPDGRPTDRLPWVKRGGEWFFS